MEFQDVTVALQSMPPYARLDLVDGAPVATGCLGDIWSLLAEILRLRSRYTVFDEDPSSLTSGAEVLLVGATSPWPNATQLAFVSSWYDIHLEESLAASTALSYLNNWSMEHWLSSLAMTILYPLALFSMLRCAENNCPVTAIDLPPIIPTIYSSRKPTMGGLKPRWRHALMIHAKLRVRNEESLGSCVMASVAAVSSQGNSVHSHVPAIRILVVSFLLFGMIMTSAYSALLVSQLTAGPSAQRVLANEEGTTLCIRENSLPYQMQHLLTHPRTLVASSCVHALCSGSAALETPELIGVTNVPCRIITLRQRQFQFKLAIGVTKQAPKALQEDIQLTLCRLREVGLTSCIHRRWLRRPEMLGTTGVINEVTLVQVSGVLAWYLTMACCSVLILMLEMSVSRRYSIRSN